jgi:hypothetical protein
MITSRLSQPHYHLVAFLAHVGMPSTQIGGQLFLSFMFDLTLLDLNFTMQKHETPLWVCVDAASDIAYVVKASLRTQLSVTKTSVSARCRSFSHIRTQFEGVCVCVCVHVWVKQNPESKP